MGRRKGGKRAPRKPLTFSQSVKRYDFWKAFTYRIKKRPQIAHGIFMIIIGFIIMGLPFLTYIREDLCFSMMFGGFALVFIGVYVSMMRFELWIRR